MEFSMDVVVIYVWQLQQMGEGKITYKVARFLYSTESCNILILNRLWKIKYTYP